MPQIIRKSVGPALDLSPAESSDYESLSLSQLTGLTGAVPPFFLTFPRAKSPRIPPGGMLDSH